MIARGEQRILSRPPSDQQKAQLDQWLELTMYRNISKLASNEIVVREELSGKTAALEAKYRKFCLLVNNGFHTKSADEQTVDDLRRDSYYSKSKLSENDQGDPFEQILTTKEGGEDLENAVKILQKSIPSWPKPDFMPSERVLKLFIEANIMIPITERSNFMYLVNYNFIKYNFQ